MTDYKSLLSALQLISNSQISPQKSFQPFLDCKKNCPIGERLRNHSDQSEVRPENENFYIIFLFISKESNNFFPFFLSILQLIVIKANIY